MARIIQLGAKCPPHTWSVAYDAEGEIIGRICLKCGTVEGRME